MMPPSPLPMDSLWMSSAATANQLQPGQISPLSAGLDNSSAPTMVHSASSSCADSWSTDYVDRDDVEMDNNWEQGSDDILTIPKLEPVEDDLNMDDLKAAPLAPASMDSAKIDPKPKRPRGRPRKHPLTTAVSASKVTKGRSKTGCITCRKRKKKCDEAKPRCMNCEKNAVVCEGYHEKQIWKSGKEKAEEGTFPLINYRHILLIIAPERLRQEALPMITMQPIFHGVETVEDKIFWKHYITHLSNVLTVEGEARNAFKDIILHLANEHQGLMHSILAVSSKHIDWDTPYGAKLLADYPRSDREALQQRADYHHDESMKRLYEDMECPLDKDDPEYKTILSARYGQMLCLLLQTRADGNPRGEHRVHLQAYQTLIQHSPPEDPALYTFITEFFQYHIFADDLFWHPENMTARLSSEDWEPVAPIQPPRLIGVGDGLFQYLSQITTIRNTIRANISAGVDPVVDYTSLYQAAEIDAAIREWTPNWPWGDSRDRVGLLYKQMMWVYLFRTIYPPSVSSMRRSTFSTLPISASTTVAPPPPPPRRASMMATVSRGNGVTGATDVHMASSCPTSRNPSRTNSMHEQDSSTCQERASSPPPSRRPAYHDRRITLAVEESLTILESFKPSDPSQTLLLIPCLVIGTACFEPAQQERIRTAVRAVRGYTGLRNCERVMELLEKVWACMDQGDWVSVWDWQGVARRMRLDFSCA
ncbi:C6 zink-finger PRO1A [Fusarium mundagurra]|uniref:C6 zink-finger PRO1A n=1 Tax=Fusarium mundagurra TaxID=1567541 RepID=A0A8H6DN70_9HYPO|nr:C6 zink-finger PRO1A [Fusarium mundagurra]